MRQSVPFAPIRRGSWEAASGNGIELLPLNRDLESGARTILIRSAPRAGIERKAQFHECEEEFLCLAGRFTFDGVHWMRPLSYTCYPPHVVHGASVAVPEGYLLYLRNSGAADAHPVQVPASQQAYHHPDFPVREPIVTLEQPFEGVESVTGGAVSPARIRRTVLRTQAAHGAEVALWEFSDGEQNIFEHFPVATPLEVLIASTDSESLAYGCYCADEARPVIETAGPVVALVHSGPWA